MHAPSRRPRMLVLVLAALLACPDDAAPAGDEGSPPIATAGNSFVLAPGAHLVPVPAPAIRERPGSSQSRRRPPRTLHVTARDSRDDADAGGSEPGSSWPDLQAVPDPSLDLRTPGGPIPRSHGTRGRAGLHDAVIGTRLRC